MPCRRLDDACWANYYGLEQPGCAPDDEECWDAWWDEQNPVLHAWWEEDDTSSWSSSDEGIPDPDCDGNDGGCWGMYMNKWYSGDDFDCADLDGFVAEVCRMY